MRQRLDIGPMPDRIHGVEFPDQLQQAVLAAGCFRRGSADPGRQSIRRRPPLLLGQLLRRRPVMDWDRLTPMKARYNPRALVHIHGHRLASFPRRNMT
jgi:hypothetical protein